MQLADEDKLKQNPLYNAIKTKFDNLMKALFHQKGAQLDIHILEEKEAQSFINTHAQLLDSSFEKVEMTDKMKERLTRSNYIFSGIKTFHELNEAFPSLLDENGDRKPFERFLNDVQKINDTYNTNYLRAEYNFVQASAQMAAKWEQYSEDGDRYYLQYRTAHDDKVRPEHAALDRITLPMSDPFWETYYPPNGWNCFVSGTPVLTGEGWKRIESIKKGDLVIGGSGKLRKVIGTHSRVVNDELISVVIKGASAACTPNHRFCTPYGWVDARSLHEGDIIIQSGENSALHLLVHAIANACTLLRYGLMACKRKWKSVSSLAVDDEIERGNEKVNHIASKKLSLLEWQSHCYEMTEHDFFAFTHWAAKCAHTLRMKPTGDKGVLQGLRLGGWTKKRGTKLELGRYLTNELAIGLGFALSHMKTFLSKVVVCLCKPFSCGSPSGIVANPLSADGITTMTDRNTQFGQNLMHGPAVDTPMGTEPPEATTLSNIPAFCGIKDIHAFDGFNSFYDFLRNTFFHNRYVLVRGKVTKKKRDYVVYNLSIFKDESYIVPIGITHNCRCNVVQVRKQKYPATPHQEAMERGNEALNSDRYDIFRFNSGKQGKAMPDYNPYTIKRCNDCDVAKGGSVKLAFVPENELCAACKIVRACIKDDAKQTRHKAKILQGAYIENGGFNGKVSISKNSIKEWINQPFRYVNEKNRMLLDIKSIFGNATYLGTADNHKGVKDVVRSHIFETSVKDIKAYIIVREYTWGDFVLHSISEGGKLIDHIKKK